MKNVLLLLSVFLLNGLAYAAVIEEPLKNDKGIIMLGFGHSGARYHCERHGKRLPTVRELATEATHRGAVIIEEKDFDPNNLPTGFVKENFRLIWSLVDETTEDSFYYSVKNYQWQYEYGFAKFWSARLPRSGRTYSIDYLRGDIWPDYDNGQDFDLYGVRCLKE